MKSPCEMGGFKLVPFLKGRRHCACLCIFNPIKQILNLHLTLLMRCPELFLQGSNGHVLVGEGKLLIENFCFLLAGQGAVNFPAHFIQAAFDRNDEGVATFHHSAAAGDDRSLVGRGLRGNGISTQRTVLGIAPVSEFDVAVANVDSANDQIVSGHFWAFHMG